MNHSKSVNPLQALLELSAGEQLRHGLQHTPQEIARQPQTWRTTFQLVQENRAAVDDFLTAGPPENVIFSGAGTSDYIGQCLVPLWRRNGYKHTSAIPSTTLLTELDDYLRPADDCLLVSISRSGASPEGVAVLEETLKKYPRARHLVITCNRQGQMAQLAAAPNAFCLVLDESTNDQGLAMTASFSNLLLAGQLIAAPDFINIDTLCEAGAEMLAQAARLAFDLAARDFTRACFLGAGAFYGVARESALKTMELTAGRILTMAETPLGLRHGPLSALDANTLLVLFLSGDKQRRAYEIRLLEEIKGKNLGCAQVVVTNGADAPADVTLNYQTPTLPDLYRPPVDAIFGQLFGLFASLRHGLQPDTPSPSGAINRVVSSI